MTGTLSFDSDTWRLTLPSGVDRRVENDVLVLHEDDLAGVGAADLRRVLGRADGFDGDVRVSDVPYDLFDSEGSEVLPFTFNFDRPVTIGLEFEQEDWEDDEDAALARVSGVLSALAKRHRFRVEWAGHDPYYPYGPPYQWRARLLPVVGGRPVAGLLSAARESVALLEAMSGGTLTRRTALELLRARPEALIGVEEGPWLDVKRQGYDLTGHAGRIALAQAVARFANAEDGGIVVVGMEARKVPGGEEIRALRPVPTDARARRRYQDALEQHLFPAPDSLVIERVDVPGGMLVIVHLPPQREELKPFLVHGALVGPGKAEGAFISIVRRRGDSSIPVTAAAVHSMLAAGRALLARGQLPNDRDAPGRRPPRPVRPGPTPVVRRRVAGARRPRP